MSEVLYNRGELTLESVRRTGRIGARAPEFIRLTAGTDEEVELEPRDVEQLVAILDVWLEDRRR